MLRKLNSWNLSELKKFKRSYLSGFKSEMYQGGPRQGYAEAENMMEEDSVEKLKKLVGLK